MRKLLVIYHVLCIHSPEQSIQISKDLLILFILAMNRVVYILLATSKHFEDSIRAKNVNESASQFGGVPIGCLFYMLLQTSEV